MEHSVDGVVGANYFDIAHGTGWEVEVLPRPARKGTRDSIATLD